MKKRVDFNDLTGKVFGDLTVLSLAFTKNKVSHWNCKCKCGRNRVVRSRYLTQTIYTACSVCSKAKNVGHHYVEMTGKKVGKLSVVGISHYDMEKRTYFWRCLCDCGKETVVSGSCLRSERTKSCGCLVVEATKRRAPCTDLLGKVFGRLTVDSLVKTERRSIWLCKCSCGKELLVNTSSLTSGHTKSCGCYKNDQIYKAMQARKLPNNEAGFNRVYQEYRVKNAERRDLPFELTKELFRELTQKPCHYCGVAHSKNQQGFLYNGIDRVDNTKGYVIGNVVPCCFTCNISKARMTSEEFFSWIERVHAYQHRQIDLTAISSQCGIRTSPL